MPSRTPGAFANSVHSLMVLSKLKLMVSGTLAKCKAGIGRERSWISRVYILETAFFTFDEEYTVLAHVYKLVKIY